MWEFSVLSLRFFNTADFQGIVISKIIHLTKIMLFKSTYPCRFPLPRSTVKIPKSNFFWNTREFYLPKLCLLNLVDFQGIKISKIIHLTEIMLFKSTYPCRFPLLRSTVKIPKSNFFWNIREFSLPNLRYQNSVDFQDIEISKIIHLTEIMLFET